MFSAEISSFGRKIISDETLFWPEYLSAEKMLPDEKYPSAKIVHENRGRRQGVVRFDVQRFGRKSFRPKK
jgi:hypothetical protein